MGYFYLLIAIIGEVIGTTHLKSTNNFTELLPTTYVVLGFATAFYFMMLAMKTIPIAIAYSIWAAIGISAITILGRTLGNSEGFAVLTSGLEGLVLKYLFSKLIICLSRDLAFFPPKTTPIIL